MSEEVSRQQQAEDLPFSPPPAEEAPSAPSLVSYSNPEPAATTEEEAAAAPRLGLLLASSAVEPVNLSKFVFQYTRFLVSMV